jgi:hypothetical protein
MCAMMQKLRMNFGSMEFGYRFRLATAFIFSVTGRSRMLRGAKIPGRAKPCRMTVQFATNQRAAQPCRLLKVNFSGEPNKSDG